MQSENTQKKWRRHILSILGACLVCLIAAAADYYSMGTEVSSRVYEELSEPEDCESILDEVKMSASNSKLEGLTVTYQKSDPKLMLQFPDDADRKVRTVVLKLEDSFLHEVDCTLYYRKRGGEYKENKRDIFTLPAGETIVYFQIPDDVNYLIHELRIDIDEDYTIQDILVSENSLSSAHQVAKSKKAVVLYLLVWLAVFECFFCLLYQIRLPRGLLREKAAACGKQVLFYAGSALVGNVGAYLVFRVIDREYYGYWAALIGVCSMLLAWQGELLLKGGFSLKYQGEPSSGGRLRRICYAIGTAVFCFLILFMYREGILKTEKLAGKIRFLFPFLFAVIETVILSLLYYKNILNKKEDTVSFYRAYLFVVFLLGIGYMLVFLPFVSPDEPSHYVSAYRVSNLILGRFGQWGDESLLMRTEDFAFFHLRKKVLNGYYFTQITDDFQLLAQETGYVAVDAPMVTNAIFCYVISGLGIAAARVLHLSAGMTFYAGRLANFLFFMATLRWLMKKIPFGRTALFTIAALPMMLQLMTTYSYDVLTFCFVALFVTQVMSMICADGEVSKRDFRLCLAYAVLMAPSKVVYIPLLFLILLVPAKNLEPTGKKAWGKKLTVIGTGILAAAIVLFLVSWANENSTLRQMLNTNSTKQILSTIDEPCYSLSWILTHLWEYFLMNIRTLVERLDYYFFTMIGRQLGWLDINLPYTYSVVSFVLYLLAVNIRDENSAEISTGAGRRLWIVVLGTGTVLAVTLMMALSFTPVTYNYVLGVQGRYFLPLLIPGIWILKSRMIQVNSIIRRHIVLIETLLNLWILVYVFTKSMMRL